MESGARGDLGSARALACNCQSGSDFRRRAETNLARRGGGTALPWEGKSTMTRASSPAREAPALGRAGCALPGCEFSRDGRYTSSRYNDYRLEMVAVVPSILVKLTVNFSL
jgi:hypothetical protein